jgi:hypothetical protein
MTQLKAIADTTNPSIALSVLPSDSELVRDIQERLGKIGLLDLTSAALGTFDGTTDIALQKFQKLARRSATSDIDRSLARKFIDITRDVDLPVASNSDVVINLTGRVGAGNSKNLAADVLAVKNRLADLGFPIQRTTNVGNKTIEVIKLFQAIINEKQNLDRVDGIVDPDGKTLKALQKSFAPRWQEMLPGSVQAGYLNSDFLAKEDSGDFGTTWMVETIQAAGEIYKRDYLNNYPNAALIAVNDISRENGGSFPPHQGHQVGLCCDLYLPRKDGRAGLTDVNSNEYDRDAMKAILTAFHQQSKHKIVRIFLDDSVLSGKKIQGVNLCTREPNHKDHAHVEIRPASLSIFRTL